MSLDPQITFWKRPIRWPLNRGAATVNDSRLRAYLIYLVSTLWALNIVVPVFVKSYESNLAINGPFLLVLGSLFATRGKGNDDAK